MRDGHAVEQNLRIGHLGTEWRRGAEGSGEHGQLLALDGDDVAARDGVAWVEDGVVEHALEIHHGRPGGNDFEVNGDGEGSLCRPGRRHRPTALEEMVTASLYVPGARPLGSMVTRAASA